MNEARIQRLPRVAHLKTGLLMKRREHKNETRHGHPGGT
jgi:hypothetical protein